MTAIAFGVVIGLALGLLGGGGSILTVPIFVYVLHADPKAAIAMGLAVVGLTSTIGAVGHWRSGNVNLRVGTIFAAVGLVAAYVGARLSVYVPGALQLLLLASVMATAAVVMLRERPVVERGVTEEAVTRGWPILVAAAFVVGSLTGLVGVGGGFLIVPTLVALGVPMREAVGSSLGIIAVNASVGFAGYAGRVPIDWQAVALVSAGTAPGIATGVLLHRRVSQRVLRRAFAVLLMLISAFMLSQQAGPAMRHWFGRG